MKDKVSRFLPWFIGSCLAAGSLILSARCTVPVNGSCSTCGSCAVPLVSLVSWGISGSRKKEAFYR